MIVSSVKDYFETLPQRFVSSAAKGVNAILQYELTGDGGGTYHVTVNDGTMAIADGPAATPTATIKMESNDYIDMVNGKLSGTMAFMKGKLAVSGNVLVAQKMQAIFPPHK
jgi:putative sterol carrier protein